MGYWALQANPSRYRILQAALDVDEVPWTANQYADQVQVGDKVLIWLSGPNSGGYALGEVTARATQMPEDPRFASYWVGAGSDDDVKAMPRLRVRFTRRMYLYPLLRSRCKQDPVLSQMHIMRQAAGTIFKITNEEWARVQEIVEARGKAWKREETLLALGLYFDLQAGAASTRDVAVQRLARLLNRSTGDVEARLDVFRQLDSGATAASGVGVDVRPIWDELGARPEEAPLAREIEAKLLEGGGLESVRDASEGQRGKDEVRLAQRSDPAFARERFEQLLKDEAVRRACLAFLADSIQQAHSYGAARWGVTLRLSKKIHLNVGRFLAFGIYDGEVWVGLHKEELSEQDRVLLNGTWEDPFIGYNDITACRFPASRLAEMRPRIENAHRRFLKIAAESAKQTPYFKSHSPGVITYLRKTLERPSLPDPAYVEDGSGPGTPRPSIHDHLRARGLHFPSELVTTYLLSLKTKPFVILSGISGTGKTKLAQAVAEWAGSEGEELRRHEFISVRPDWLDGKEVLGFYNVLTEQYAPRPFLNLLLRAHRDPHKPHFVILDEMNLARVEHYFADLLSVTESRTLREGKLRQESLHLHDRPRCLPLAPPEARKEPARCTSCQATSEEVAACPLHFDGVQMVPPKLGVPANVYITGTVNIDETTHMFSPKVLDRGNVIEFNEVDLRGYGKDAKPGGFALRDGQIDLGATTVARQDNFLGAPDEVRNTLAALNDLLAESNLHFGYRVANEIALYVQLATAHVGPDAVDVALDLQVLQKVLPKLHGSKQKLLEPLWRVLLFTLFGKDLGVAYGDADFQKFEQALRKNEPVVPPGGGAASPAVMPRSAAKLARMLRMLRSQGFVSFIE